MKKLITLFSILMAVVISLPAQISWDQVKVSTTETPGVDTAYFAIICRGGAYQSLMQNLPDTVTSAPTPAATNFEAGDSLTWRIERGAPFGSSPRIRIINVRSGQYLYIGKKGGTTKKVYMGGRDNPYGDCKDFYLYDRGPRVAAEYYYAIADVEGSLLNQPSAGVISFGGSDKAADSKHMWRFNRKNGPLPKPTPKPVPEIGIQTVETSVHAGGSATIKVQVTKGATDLNGNTLLYVGNTFVDTLQLDANGGGEHILQNLKYGVQTFTVVYTDDTNYEPVSAKFEMQVLASLTAKKTAVAITTAPNVEVHSDLKVDFKLTDSDNSPVSEGVVYVTVNGNLKNSFTPDVLGMGSVTFPNILVGSQEIAAYYTGDKEDYLDSDTTKVSVTGVATTNSSTAYPVYFDLGTIYEVQRYLENYTTGQTTRSFNVTFAADSFPAIQLATDTAVVKTMYAQYNAQALKYESSDLKDMRNRADQFTIPFGTGSRPSWVNFKTPWLNKGSYNIYLSQRVNTASGMYPTVSLDGKVLYYPNAELVEPSFRTYAGNNVRRWNAKGNNNNLAMHYFGSVSVGNDGVHDLKFEIIRGSENIWIDMIEFIPVDMDSLRISEKASIGLAKIQYPLFDLSGAARFEGDLTIVSSMADLSEMAVPFQVSDPTNYTKYPFALNGLGVITKSDLTANYVIVYRAEDKWTRVAEGSIIDGMFTGELPIGDYFYQEINFIDIAPGTAGIRTVISEGTFSVGASGLESIGKQPAIYAHVSDCNLNVRGISSGDQLIITDVTGKIIEYRKVSSDSYSKQLAPSVYIVKVVSVSKGTHTMKVIVR